MKEKEKPTEVVRELLTAKQFKEQLFTKIDEFISDEPSFTSDGSLPDFGEWLECFQFWLFVKEESSEPNHDELLVKILLDFSELLQNYSETQLSELLHQLETSSVEAKTMFMNLIEQLIPDELNKLNENYSLFDIVNIALQLPKEDKKKISEFLSNEAIAITELNNSFS